MPNLRRKAAPAPARPRAIPKTFPAPVRGWVTSESLAIDKPGGASVLENFFPTTRGIRPRGGAFRHATITDGVDSLMALISGGASVMLGEGVRLFEVPVPLSLADRPLSASGIGSYTGLSVVALDVNGSLTTQLTADTILPNRATLLMLGSAAQRQQFAEQFERNGR